MKLLTQFKWRSWRSRPGKRGLAASLLLMTFSFSSTSFADGNGNADVVNNIGCMEEQAGISLGCTANDISLAAATNIAIIDDGCNAIGDTVTFSADFEVLLTAQNRHDIGIWFSTDGDPNGDAARSGTCTAASPAFGPAPMWTDIDTPLGVPDSCGDITSDNNPLFPNIELTVTCIDNDGNGKLNIPNCTSWRQPGANEICNSAADAYPGAPSKCKCDDGFEVDIDVPPPIYSITKLLLDADGNDITNQGDPTAFDFTIAGVAADPAQATLMAGEVATGTIELGTLTISEQITNTDYGIESWECTIDGLNGASTVTSSTENIEVTLNDGDGSLDCVVTNQLLFVEIADINIVKSPDTQTIISGDSAVFTLSVSTSGNVPISGVTVSDNQCTTGPTFTGGDTNADNLLDAGETWSYDCTVANVTQDFTNVASVTGTSPSGTNVNDTDSADVEVLNPSLAITKTLDSNADEDESQDVSVGDTLSYTVTATNDGTADLTNVLVSDNLITPSQQTCATLAPTETCVLTGTYVVQTIDLGGDIINTATAGSDQTDDVDASVTEPVPSPSLDINKELDSNADEDGSGDVSVGDTLTYTITASNDGDANLTDVVVSDSKITPNQQNCAFVAPGSTCVLTGVYIVQPGDIGTTISNTGVAGSDQTDDVDDTETVEVPTPSLAIMKTLSSNADEDGSGDVSVGDTLTYTITATSNGTANLSNVVVTDSLITPNQEICAALAPGGTCVLTGIYVVQTGDIGMDISNTGVAGSNQTDDVDDTVTVPVPTPSLAVTKTILSVQNPDGTNDPALVVDQAGDIITYSIVVENNGTANLTGVIVSDPLTGTSNASCSGLLLPTETCSVTGTYTASQTDIDENGRDPANGFINNTATGTSDQTGPEEGSAQIEVLQLPDHSLDKSFDQDPIEIGAMGTFTLTYTNTGNVTLNNVEITDEVATILNVDNVSITAGSCAAASQSIDCDVSTLAPGDSVVVTVGFTAAPPLPQTNQTSGASYIFYFDNGYVLTGSTATGESTLIYPDGTVESPANVTGANQDIVFNTPDGQSFGMHLSCSEPFVDGYGITGPTEADNAEWKISSYSVDRYNSQGFLKSCSQSFAPLFVDNIASATASPVGGTLPTNPIEGADSVELIQVSPIEISRKRVRRGNVEIQYFNTSREDIEIAIIGVTWTDGAVLQSASYQDGVDLGLTGGSPQSASLSNTMSARSKDWLRLDFDPAGAPDGLTVTIVLTTGETLTDVY